MKFIIQCIRRQLGMFMTAICFLIIESIADLMQPSLMSGIVDKGIKNRNTHVIWRYGGSMLIVALIGAIGAVAFRATSLLFCE